MARIAIVGTGIAGLAAARLLNTEHDIVVYEKSERLGGHTRTITIDYDGHTIPVDTGFIVFNRPNYPSLTSLFEYLGVPVSKSDMSFAATIGGGRLEWGARNLNAVFGQRRNLLSPRFVLLVRDVLRFNAGAERVAERYPHFTLGELIAHMGLGDWFRHFYLLPMCGAIWSCPPKQMLSFPARTLVRFFVNHHLTSTRGQPQWYTVEGGAQEYVARLSAPFADRVRIGCGVVAITRAGGKPRVRDTSGESRTYDEVVLACHGDEALALLTDADVRERAALAPFQYQKNVAVLHRDVRVMPRRRRCWASWVYSSDGVASDPRITVHYCMNRLQNIDSRYPLFVSLNPGTEIDCDKVFDRHEFSHPVFDRAAIAAQSRVMALQGARNTWYCGAHLGYGFHEDGLSSAEHVARLLRCAIPWQREKAVVDIMPRTDELALTAA